MAVMVWPVYKARHDGWGLAGEAGSALMERYIYRGSRDGDLLSTVGLRVVGRRQGDDQVRVGVHGPAGWEGTKRARGGQYRLGSLREQEDSSDAHLRRYLPGGSRWRYRQS